MNDINFEIFYLYFIIVLYIHFLKEKFVSKGLSNEFFIVGFQRINKIV